MAALDFPASPTTNQQFAAPNGTLYVYDGTVWKVGTVTGSPVVIGPTAPTSPVVGQMWWRNDPDGNLFVYYNDGTSSQFVPATSILSAAPAGVASGDLAGTYPNPTINGVYPLSISVLGRVNRTTAQSIANNTWTALSFDTVGVNQGAMWSAGTPDRLIVKQAGIYLFGGTAQFDAASTTGSRNMSLYLSGATVATDARQPVSGYPAVSLATAIPASVNDYLQLMVMQNSGAALNVNSPAFFWACRIL